MFSLFRKRKSKRKAPPTHPSPHVQAAMQQVQRELKLFERHQQGLAKARMLAGQRGLKIHLGCGPVRKEGWINVDLYGEPDLMLDLREPLPLEDGSCRIIYSEHFFEHVDYPAGAQRILADCLRLLEPGGVFSVGVPDTQWPLEEYTRTRQEGYFTQAKKVWHPAWCETELDHINYHFRQDGRHLYAYDCHTLCRVLEKAGFVNARRRPFDPELDSAKRELGTLYVEANRAA
jgi:predicted SAM-dependent methyltransferase